MMEARQIIKKTISNTTYRNCTRNVFESSFKILKVNYLTRRDIVSYIGDETIESNVRMSYYLVSARMVIT